jgi:hypothetical protein
MNKFCSREFTSEQCFGRDECGSCGTQLKLKNEVGLIRLEKIRRRDSKIRMMLMSLFQI